MVDNCVFCKIVEGKIPSFKLYEDESCIVILDKFPATKGQSLVISKKHVDYILDLGEKEYLHLFEVSRKIGKAIDKSLKALRTCFIVEGFEVPHVHIRIHPAYEKRLALAGIEATSEELAEVLEKIKKGLK